jgi:hypothetical protein
MTQVAILGAGMAGFGAAHRLHAEGLGSIMYDQKPYAGTPCPSITPAASSSTTAPHISFTKNERIQQLFADSVRQEFETIHAYVNNYRKGHWIKHPAQCNLHGLPAPLLVDILSDMVEAKQHPTAWLPTTPSGSSHVRADVRDDLPMEYGLSAHTTEAANMTTDWLGPRLYRPELREVFQGRCLRRRLTCTTSAISLPDEERIRVVSRRVSRPDRRASRSSPQSARSAHSNHVVRQWHGRQLRSRDLIDSAAGAGAAHRRVPADVIEAARQLACLKCVMVNIGVAREDISPAH